MALQQIKEPNPHELSRFRVAESVKLRPGVPETNQPNQPPRARSANVVDIALCDMNSKPVQQSAGVRETVCLVQCDSTDTMIARSRCFWVPERSLDPKPYGEGRDFLSPRPKWTKKYGGVHPRYFSDIAEAQRQASLTSGSQSPRPPPPRPSTLKSPRRPPPLVEKEEIPAIRQRRQCPPPTRVRLSPRVEYRAAPALWNFSCEIPGVTPIIPEATLSAPITVE